MWVLLKVRLMKMEYKDVVLPSDSDEIAQLEASLKASSGWKPKGERSLVWHSRYETQKKMDRLGEAVRYDASLE